MNERQVSHCRFVLWSEGVELAGKAIGLDDEKMRTVATEMLENECLWDKSCWNGDEDKLGSAVCYVALPEHYRKGKTGINADFIRNRCEDKCTIHILNVALKDGL